MGKADAVTDHHRLQTLVHCKFQCKPLDFRQAHEVRCELGEQRRRHLKFDEEQRVS